MIQKPEHVKLGLAGAGCLTCGADVAVTVNKQGATTECAKHGVVEYAPGDGMPHWERTTIANYRHWPKPHGFDYVKSIAQGAR